jgi:hypothetical protein
MLLNIILKFFLFIIGFCYRNKNQFNVFFSKNIFIRFGGGAGFNGVFSVVIIDGLDAPKKRKYFEKI